MGLKNQKLDRLMELIFDNPNTKFTIREISKKTRIPKTSVQRYIKKLKNQNIIDNENKLVFNNYTKFLKAFFIIEKIMSSNLLDYLEKNLKPSTIILFGGARKGEYDKDSDIDLFIESTKKIEPELEKFEKKLNHKIHLFVEVDIRKLPPRLLNNIVNGIKLSGYFKVK